jgi:hypothetical protein
MAGIDADKLLTEAHEALQAVSSKDPAAPYREYALGLVEAYEGLEQAYKVAQRELDPPPRSALFWALLDGEMAAHTKAVEYRREAAR